VPKDLKINGKQETFVATISYDTLDLYGKVEATLPIVVEALLPEKVQAKATP
jgi:hypothetical protein